MARAAFARILSSGTERLVTTAGQVRRLSAACSTCTLSFHHRLIVRSASTQGTLRASLLSKLATFALPGVDSQQVNTSRPDFSFASFASLPD
jgi:hypothetical protein